MNFHLKHRGVARPDGLKQKIEQKMSRFERVLPDTAYVEMELIDHPQHHDGQKEVEIIVDVPGGKSVTRFKGKGVTFLAAVDQVIDKLDDEMSKQKDRQSDRSYKGAPPKEWLANQLMQDEQ